MTIRLALVIPTMDRGGAEKQLCLLAENLPRSEFEVHVILLTRDGPLSERLRAAGIPVTVIGKRFKADPSALFRLRRELVRLNPDVVHTWLFAANCFGRVAAKMAGVKTIIASERCVDPWKTASHFLIDRQLAKFTDAITTNSSGVVDFYVDYGLDRQLFCVIPNGIEPRSETETSHGDTLSGQRHMDRRTAFERLQVPENRRLILAVGRLWPQKRYRDLIWAAELLATLREDVSLVIIGDGPQSGELLRHRDAVTTPDRVRFAGDRSDVAELLPHADVFWIGSEYEGQSNSVIEAMQAGLPVVASDIPGNRDLVVHAQRDQSQETTGSQETGRLVALGDTADFARQTNVLLDDRELARALGLAGQQRIASEFTVARMVDAHADLYRSQLDH